MKPWLYALITNVTFLLVLTAIGFGWMAYINTITYKLYGDHCVDDKDCATDMNYICQNGKCDCLSTTYYVSAKSGCGIYLKKILINNSNLA
jgi:hypothetical protein